MGVDEPPTPVDTKEIDEGNGDTEGTELSEGSSLDAQVGEDTGTTESEAHPLPDELNRTIEPPLGIDGDKMVQEPKPKPARKKESKQEQLTHKLYNQLIRTLQSDKTRKDMKQIQKRLAQVEKNTTNIKLQQELGKQLLAQVKLMQRRLEKIDSAISRSKTKGNTKREKIRVQATKVTKTKKRSK
jgi:hypothetical protein